MCSGAFINKYKLNPKISPVIACGRAVNRKDTDKIYEAWIELMKKILARLSEEENLQSISPLDDIYSSILRGVPMCECSFNGSCGVHFMSVYPDGEVGFCGHDNTTRFLTYGNLKEKNLLELYTSANAEKIRARQEFLKNHSCKNCTDWNLCHGGCAFEAVNFFGTLEAKYPNCAARKKFLAWLKTDGLKFIKTALLREKSRQQKLIENKMKLLDEVDNWTAN